MSPRRAEPPTWARRLMRLLADPEDRAFILSDLADGFEQKVHAEGPRRARAWYRSQVLRSLLPTLGRRLAPRPGPAPDRRGGAGSGEDRASRGATLAADGVRDLALALRTLRKDPLLVLVTLTSVGLGVGVVTSVFAVANSLLMRPPAGVVNPQGLVVVFSSQPNGRLYGETSFQDYLDLDREVEAFQGVAAHRVGDVVLARGETRKRLMVEVVTGNFFQVLDVPMALGRTFSPEETRVGSAEPLVVLSHRTWSETFGADPGVLGSVVRLGDRDFTVIGVAPPGLLGRFLQMRVDAWVPVGIPGGTSRATPQELADRGDRDYSVTARLAPDASLAQAQAQLGGLASRLAEAHPELWTGDRGDPLTFTAVPERDARIPPDGKAALAGLAALLLSGAGLILLVACSNVAGLFLARAQRRRREMAVRISLGAGRGRLIRMLLTESLLLALAATAVGLGVAAGVAHLMGAIPFPMDVPLGFDVDVDRRVVAFSLGVTLLVGLAFGLVPALDAARPDLVPALKGDASGGRPRRMGLRNVLVTVQLAGSLVLVVSAGFVLRGLDRVRDADLGLDTRGVALMSMDLASTESDLVAARAHALELEERIASWPGVAGAALALEADASLFADIHRARLEMEGIPPGEAVSVPYNAVTPDYFELLDVPLLRGRYITDDDGPGAPRVAVVTESFARRFWPEEEALGRTFTVTNRRVNDSSLEGESALYQVVGIVPGVTLEPGREPPASFWTSLLQDFEPQVVIHVRARGDAAELVPLLRAEARLEGLGSQLISPQTYDGLVDFLYLGPRLASRVLSWTGLLTLLLAAVGVYGIVSYLVSRRIREMAIRQALGAEEGRVVREVIAAGMVPVAVGVVLGLAAVIPLAVLARSLLYGVGPLDPVAVGGGTSVLLITALVACWLPARRITRVDAMSLLRNE